MTPTLADAAVCFVLVLSRLGGLLVFAPLLSSAAIPVRARAMVALVLAAAITPTLAPHPASRALDVPVLLATVLGETLIGLTIGLLAAIPVYSVQLAGLLMGQQLGLSLAGAYNPALESEGEALGDLLLYLAMATFIALGGLEAMFLCVAATFERVPIGTAGLAIRDLERLPLATLVGLTHSGFDLALRVAGPLVCIVLLETVAVGFIMKTLPQLNIFSIGFAVKILLGLSALLLSLAAIEQAVGGHVEEGLRIVADWVSRL